MITELESRIARAVEKGVAARGAYYAAISLPNVQTLGDPADERQLRSFESMLKKQLPPSYRAFLRLHGGWRMALGAVDLLTIAEMMSGDRADRISEWQAVARKNGDSIAATSLVIGFSEATSIRILLNPAIIDESGEWEILGHDNGVEWRFPSFIAWLEESIQDFNELTREESEGDDYEESVVP